MIIIKKKDGKTFKLSSPFNLVIDFNANINKDYNEKDFKQK